MVFLTEKLTEFKIKYTHIHRRTSMDSLSHLIILQVSKLKTNFHEQNNYYIKEIKLRKNLFLNFPATKIN